MSEVEGEIVKEGQRMRQSSLTSAGRAGRIVRAAAIELAAPAAETPEAEAAPAASAAAPTMPAPPPPSENQDARAFRALLDGLQRQVADFQARRRQTIDDAAQVCVELSVALAERLVCTALQTDRQRLDRIVRQALDRLPGGRPVAVHAHPDDHALLQRQLSEDAEGTFAGESLTFTTDPNLPRGQVRLETGDLFVEWNTAACLADLRNALLEEIGQDA